MPTACGLISGSLAPIAWDLYRGASNASASPKTSRAGWSQLGPSSVVISISIRSHQSFFRLKGNGVSTVIGPSSTPAKPTADWESVFSSNILSVNAVSHGPSSRPPVRKASKSGVLSAQYGIDSCSSPNWGSAEKMVRHRRGPFGTLREY